MPFPSLVNTQPAIACPGDFVKTERMHSIDAGPGGLVAGAAGLTVGLSQAGLRRLSDKR